MRATRFACPRCDERREDIGLLFHHFAREELEALGRRWRLEPEDSSTEPWLPAPLAARLVRYGWPGNIRQLRNLTRQLIIDSRGQSRLRLDPRLEKELSGPALSPASPPASKPVAPPAKESPRRKLADYTEEQIVQALEENTWEIKKAAERLDVARSTLYDWLKRSPHVRLADGLSAEELARHYRECQGQLDSMSQRLKLSRWALVRRLKELGILHAPDA